ncbi:uncharacterized protein LOC128129042 [Lactuca sativa]|uniref:uncharacterized protein LOC128129042 n=1 Tax=Lactuca sativa TaxID=4236 RepID=UPI0022B02E23|nr:uncharacterized protein LOC128129042 [Lactuca sativa]
MASSSSSINSSNHSSTKIPPFDENNFAMWKIKALYALESPLKNNAPDGVMKKTPKENWTSDDKRNNGLDVRARAAISYAFPYNIFGLVQNCISAKEMMDTLTVSFEGTEEVKATQINDLNRRQDQLKHRTVLVQNEKISTMDLQSLYGNLRYYEESKLQRKELMKDAQHESSVALFSTKSQESESDTESFSNTDSTKSDIDSLEKVVASAAFIVKTFEKSGRNFSKFQKKMKGKSFKRSDADKKPATEKKGKAQCFNCGSTDYFAKECKQRTQSSDEYWKQKYNKLVEKLKAENLEHKENFRITSLSNSSLSAKIDNVKDLLNKEHTSLIDEYCVIDSNGVTKCDIEITGIDPTSYPAHLILMSAPHLSLVIIYLTLNSVIIQ